jgi:hypothetical protein
LPELVRGGARRAQAVTDLSCWVRAINSAAQRPIEVFPAGCATFCRDECMAVSMVAAGQNSVCPAMRACAYALLETSDVEQVVDSARAFGDALRDVDLVLPPDAILNAAASSVPVVRHNERWTSGRRRCARLLGQRGLLATSLCAGSAAPRCG